MSELLRDIRFAARTLRARPGFTIAAAVTLALGIGATSAIVSIVDRVLLRPFPGLSEPERVVEVASRSVSLPAYRDIKADAQPVADLAAYRNRPFAIGHGDRSRLVTGLVVSGNYFRVLGATTVLGRGLSETDDRLDVPPTAVISDRVWRSFFAGDSGVVGQTIRLNDRPVTVVGVAARDVRGTRVLYTPDVWIPVAHWPAVAPSAFTGLDPERRTWSWLTIVGRLTPGATVGQADALLARTAARQMELYPDQTPTGYAITLTPVVEAATGLAARGAVSGFLGILAAVVGFVLLIACANVANLFIARAWSRRHETAVRRALGATRARLARQLLTEAALLGAVGGLLALLVAEAALSAATSIRLPEGTSLATLDLGLDWRVTGATAVLAALSTVIFGLVPAWQGSRTDVGADLRSRTGDVHGRYLARNAFLFVQVALCLVLLIGTGLFVRSLQQALRADPGFRPEGLALASVNLGLARYGQDDAGHYFEAARQAVLTLPAVESATWVALVPLTDKWASESFTVPGYVPAPDEQLEAEVNAVGPEYFRTMGVPLLGGRGIDVSDGPTAPLVAVINETLANRYYGDTDPVGRTIELVGQQATVIGVASDHVYHRLDEEPRPYVYAPLAQLLAFTGRGEMTLVARSRSPGLKPGLGQGDVLKDAGSAAVALASVRDALTGIDPDVPVYNLATADDLYAGLLVPQRLGAALLGGLSALGLLLAAVGVYGVVAYSVTHRTREIGIRMALGAPGSSVVSHFLARGMAPVAAGTIAGLGIAALGSRFAIQFLYGVRPLDPPTYATTALVLVIVAAVAGLVPAWRATRVDPMTVLRQE
jgi:putative ABC transport system permease protein